jgi:predicted Zn-dependent peptidase
MSSETRNIRREVLPNGLVLITEAMPHVRSIAAGLWVRSGSCREPARLTGMSHFIEHMLFKGTERRTAEDLAREMDRLGSSVDAFTAKEMICFNTKVLDEHLPQAFDVLADMALHPRFAADDIAREKSVILEEIKMEQDNPEYVVYEIFSQSFWKNHALGRPILGTRQTVSRFDAATARACYRDWFAADNILITAAGNLRHDNICDLVRAQFDSLAPRGAPAATPRPGTQSRITVRKKKSLEQVQVCLGVPACPASSDRRYVAAVLNCILGGGASSRLFQKIREQQGLAYSIFSDLNPYRDAGMLCVFAGTGRETAARVIRCIVEEFRNLKQHPITAEELRRTKDHLKGSLLLALESSGARMSNLARQEIYFGRFFSIDEISAGVEAVTAEEVQQLAQELFQTKSIAATVLGNLDGFKLSRASLAC